MRMSRWLTSIHPFDWNDENARLTLETVSRAFSAFQSKGWIEVNQRDIRIVDPEALAVTVRAEVPC